MIKKSLPYSLSSPFIVALHRYDGGHAADDHAAGGGGENSWEKQQLIGVQEPFPVNLQEM